MKNGKITIIEQRATSNEQRATSNEQRATSNEQRATSNEQRADGIVIVGNIMDWSNRKYAGYRVYGPSGISPSICASGFKRDIFVLVKRRKTIDKR